MIWTVSPTPSGAVHAPARSPSPTPNRAGATFERNQFLHGFGIGLIFWGTVGLLFMAGHYAWEELKRLWHGRYLDDWRRDL